MPRPKSYDREDAIAKAAHCFWKHGFQALGVRELERHTGINQFAIQTEFGGKEGLYLSAIEYYAQMAITVEMAPLREGGIPEIIRFLRKLVTPGTMTSSAFGCLIVNTGIENARVQSPRLEAAVKAYWTALEDHFRTALSRQQNAQGTEAEFAPDALAKALVTSVMGVHAQNRTMGSETAGTEMVEWLCEMLEGLAAK